MGAIASSRLTRFSRTIASSSDVARVLLEPRLVFGSRGGARVQMINSPRLARLSPSAAHCVQRAQQTTTEERNRS